MTLRSIFSASKLAVRGRILHASRILYVWGVEMSKINTRQGIDNALLVAALVRAQSLFGYLLNTHTLSRLTDFEISRGRLFDAGSIFLTTNIAQRRGSLIL